jgi:UDP-2,3-diacylglucosamine pyrophosphatase LpxH
MELHPDLWLPAQTRVLVLSDIHLGDGSASDQFGDKDALFVDTLRAESARADVVIINGDAVDHLQGGATRRIERAHPRAFEALRELARAMPVLYVLGNHEDAGALYAAFPDFRFVHAVAVGRDLLVTHGQQFDLNWNGGGESPALVHVHLWLETTFRMPIRQPYRDYVNPLNAVIHRLFFFYTQSLRFRGLLSRVLGDPARHEHWRRVDNFWARGQWGDLGAIFEGVAAYLGSEPPWRTLIIGHSHVPGKVSVGGRTYVNAGSWALEQATVVRIDEGRVRVFDAASGQEHDDEAYHMLLAGAPLPDMAEWFRRYYRGLFRYDVEAIHRDFPRSAKENAPDGVAVRRVVESRESIESES